MKKVEAILVQIAERHLDISSLETQNSDRQDFHEVAVWNLKEALQAAYEAGLEKGAAK